MSKTVRQSNPRISKNFNMEATYYNGMCSGVFGEVESEKSDLSHEAVCFS